MQNPHHYIHTCLHRGPALGERLVSECQIEEEAEENLKKREIPVRLKQFVLFPRKHAQEFYSNQA